MIEQMTRRFAFEFCLERSLMTLKRQKMLPGKTVPLFERQRIYTTKYFTASLALFYLPVTSFAALVE